MLIQVGLQILFSNSSLIKISLGSLGSTTNEQVVMKLFYQGIPQKDSYIIVLALLLLYYIIDGIS